MARVNLTIPDHLLDLARTEFPGLNLSEALRDSLASRVDRACEHQDLECSVCARAIDKGEMIDVALGRFFHEAYDLVADLAHRAGTAEGAAMVLRRLGDQWGLTSASRVTLPRPSRRAREAALNAKLARMPINPAARRRMRTAAAS